MTVTTLDPKTALVIIDLQKGIVARPTAHPVAEVVKRASGLAAAFRRHGLPVVLVNVAGAASGRAEQARSLGEFPAGWTDLVPELNQQPDDHTVTKQTWGALNPDAHDNSIARIFPRLGETGTTREIIELLGSTRA